MEDDRYTSPTGVDKALRELTDSDLNRLIASAEARIGAVEVLGMDGLAVFVEATTRLLDGRRRWRRDLPIVVAIQGAIRSIVDDLRKKAKRRAAELNRGPVEEDMGSEGSAATGAVARDLNPEEEALRREAETRGAQLWERIMEIQFGNPHAADVVLGLYDGLEPAEIRELFELTPKQYASARRAIARKHNEIERLYAEWGKE